MAAPRFYMYTDRSLDFSWMSACPGFDELRAGCDGSHEHEPRHAETHMEGWSVATPGEAAYPRLLCHRLVAWVRRVALAPPPPPDLAEAERGDQPGLGVLPV